MRITGGRMKRIAIPVVLLALLLPAVAQAESVARVTIDMAIGPVAAKVIEEAVDRAFEEGQQALIIELNTPGGLDESMRLICRKLLNAEVPVVEPVGSIITYRCHGLVGSTSLQLNST